MLDEKEPAKPVRDGLPVQIWFICATYFFAAGGPSVYGSMFALFVIDEYGLNPLAVGYITMVFALIYLISTICVFNPISKSIGLYVGTFCGCLLFGICGMYSTGWFICILCMQCTTVYCLCFVGRSAGPFLDR